MSLVVFVYWVPYKGAIHLAAFLYSRQIFELYAYISNKHLHIINNLMFPFQRWEKAVDVLVHTST